MDSDLEALVALARKRGSKHVKKDVSSEELADSMAELGVFLLAERDRIKDMEENSGAVESLNDIQRRIDNFRRAIFALKRKMFK